MPATVTGRGRRWLAGALAALLAGTAMAVSRPATAALPATVDEGVGVQLDRVGYADVFVLLRERADLRPVARQRTHAQRTALTWQLLTAMADRSQRGVRQALRRHGVDHESFWLVNTVAVRRAPAAVVNELARRPDVRRIRLAGERRIPNPVPRAATPGVAASAVTDLAWNIDRIRAPQAWSQLSATGQGIVVASIDTGVQFDHPALVRQYRGNRGDGVFDHNYQWYDPSAVCGEPAPCDNNGHGTHVTGTMVGDDGAGTAIGVAPGARWIAAKGCESDSCSDLALLRSGQWVVAPTDLNGSNPRPDLAPHVVNNSWGGPGGDDFYQDIVNSWTAAGIFPVFAAGNAGPSCGTAISPGDYLNAYAVGAFDVDNVIAAFSSRGASRFDLETKPNIAAPGVSIRSSVPGNTYDVFSGTSMASPHVAGTIALMWSVAPALLGDIGLTRRLLDQSALDVDDLSCGGAIGDNNVWGEGRLDAYAAVERSPRGPTGSVSGVVTDAETGQPLGGVTVTAAADGGTRYSLATGPDGTYRLVLSVGTYAMSYVKFGYLTGTRTATVVEGATTILDAVLPHAARRTLTGVVRDAGTVPVPGVSVTLNGTPVPPTATAADGSFRFTDIPDGTYDLRTAARGCVAAGRQEVVVDGDETITVDVPSRPDPAGYTCHGTAGAWTGGTDPLALTGDEALTTIPLPFPFMLYGTSYSTVTVTTNGFLTFDRPVYTSSNRAIPSTAYPNAGIYPFWDDLVVDSAAGMWTAVLGTAPQRRFVVEWRNVTFYKAAGRVTFAVVLHENGRVEFEYGELSGEARARGDSATVGVENTAGTVGLQYSYNEALLVPGTSLLFRPPARVRGTVRDARTGTPIAGATVQARRDSEFVRQALTDTGGEYDLPLPVGAYTITFGKAGYIGATASVTLSADGEIATLDATLSGTGHTVSGVIRDERGEPAPGIIVEIYELTDAVTTTDAAGAFSFANVPPGDYAVGMGNPCVYSRSEDLTVDGDETVNYSVSTMTDSFGYRCEHVQAPYVDGTEVLPLTGDDSVAAVDLPFPVRLYGQRYTSAYVSSNGFLSFTDAVAAPDNGYTPSTAAPNAAVYALWQDLVIDGAASVRTAVTGQAPKRSFVVEWRNALDALSLRRITVAAVLAEDGTIDIRIRDRAGAYDSEIGIENAAGTVAFRYNDYFDPIVDGLTIRFHPPAEVHGTVRDEDGRPVADAVVAGIVAGSTEMEVRTDASGSYLLPLPPGDYTVEAAKGTAEVSATLSLDPNAVVTHDFTMSLNVVTGRVVDDAGVPQAGVTVKFGNWDAFRFVETTTAADGTYRVDAVTDGLHDVSAERYGDSCLVRFNGDATVSEDLTIDMTLSRRKDRFGYSCRTESVSWAEGTEVAPLTGDDAVATVNLPFGFTFYGSDYHSVNVSTNGFVSFTDTVPAPTKRWLPDPAAPNAAVYALWQDLVVDSQASVRTAVVGAAPNRQFVIEWRNVYDKASRTRSTFAVTLHENDQVLVSHKQLTCYSCNAGIEDAAGVSFLQFVTSTAAPKTGMAIRYYPPPG